MGAAQQAFGIAVERKRRVQDLQRITNGRRIVSGELVEQLWRMLGHKAAAF
jgi:hypothetical protein